MAPAIRKRRPRRKARPVAHRRRKPLNRVPRARVTFFRDRLIDAAVISGCMSQTVAKKHFKVSAIKAFLLQRRQEHFKSETGAIQWGAMDAFLEVYIQQLLTAACK